MNNLFKCMILAIICHITLSSMIASRAKRNNEIRVATLKEIPYLAEIGKNRYEGFIVDLMSAISNITRQIYVLYPVADAKYGKLEGAGWSGLMGEIVNRNAEIAAAPLTASGERKEAVIFTDPFDHVHLVLVVRKPTDGSTPNINSAKDLIDQRIVRPIAIRDGTTHRFFVTSVNPVFRKIGANMAEKDLVSNSEEGIKKVREGNYGFLMESWSADYWVNKKPCDLVAIKIDTDNHKLALAVAKGNEKLARSLSDAIKRMKNDKSLDSLKAKWWVHECSGSASVVTAFAAIILSFLVCIM